MIESVGNVTVASSAMIESNLSFDKACIANTTKKDNDTDIFGEFVIFEDGNNSAKIKQTLNNTAIYTNNFIVLVYMKV